MENCKANNVTDNFFYRSYWKQNKWSLCKKLLYKGLSINSYSMDVITIHQKQFIESLTNSYGSGLQHGTSPVVSFSRIFSKHLEHLKMFFLFFLFWLQFVKQEFTLFVSMFLKNLRDPVLFSWKQITFV